MANNPKSFSVKDIDSILSNLLNKIRKKVKPEAFLSIFDMAISKNIFNLNLDEGQQDFLTLYLFIII